MKMQRNIKNLLVLLFVVILIADLAASLPCKGKGKKRPPKNPGPVVTPEPVRPPMPSQFPPVAPEPPMPSPSAPPMPSSPAPPTPSSPAPPKVPGPPKSGGSGQMHGGDGTFFTPSLGACGVVNSADSAIVALAAPDFDPATPDGNPNHNNLCGKKIRIFRDGKSAEATVADRCPECKEGDVDMSPAVFNQLAQPAEGRVHVTWQFI